jgi:UDP-hydrolysing UDP-N-acetyl-D-glucosamine 2-epimerase
MRTVCVVVTARPSYSRIKTVLEAIRAHPDLELQLVVGASALLDRYGNAVDVIRGDGFDVSASVYMVIEGENPTSMAKTTGLGVLELATVLDNLRPDVVVTIADRFETLATAVAAAYMNLPLAHVQGGEVSGSIDEKVRHAVTKLSDLHFVSTERAQERVLRMGEHPAHVFVTGCPSMDLAAEVRGATSLSFDPFERYGGVGRLVDLDEPYLVVLQHPVTTEFRDARAQMVETLEAIDAMGRPALWFWPNVDAGSDGTSKAIRAFREQRPLPKVHFFRNMEPLDFLEVLVGAGCLVGNSSVGIRESSFLGVPVVNIGSRQAGRERGPNVIDVDYDRHQIVDAVERQLAHGHYPGVDLYGAGDAGVRIADLLATAPLAIEKRLAF